MKSIVFVLLPFILIVATSADSTSTPADHEQLTRVLVSHVHNGRVDYSGIKKDGRFTPYLTSLSNTRASQLTGTERLAFWINAYNAFTIKLICDNCPLRSIRDLAQGKVWDKPWIAIEGVTYSLNEIENDMIRPLGDSRIHYALVCAARSCPPLRSEAYSATSLDAQLNEQGKLFLSTQTNNTFDLATRKAQLSHVFEWYLADFGRTHEQLLGVIAKHAPDDIRGDLQQHANKWKIDYLEYDWSLNGK